jgi:hypothetical protein
MGMNDRTELVEVQFEWTRRKAVRDREKKRGRYTSSYTTSSYTGTSNEEEDEDEDEQVNHEEDVGNDSDPDDSQWTCTVSVQPVVPSTSTRPSSVRKTSSYEQQHDQSIRLKVATLSPTPHHPKVVCMLKVPFPLPDIGVDKVAVHPRPSGPEPGTGLVLTAEEIKDVVQCTGIWLVVREGVAGLGKVNRKGDGWKIRE